MLLEALVAILIFSIGILAVIGLQAASIKQASAAEYRSMAALLANDLISRMWVSDHTPATLQSNFGTSGTGYTSWLSSVQNSGLPGITSTQNVPTVSFAQGPASASGVTPSTQATITIKWQAPGETTAHSYMAIAEIK